MSPRLRLRFALLLALGLLASGCGGSARHDPPPPARFPNLGYRAVPPRGLSGLARDQLAVVDLRNVAAVRPAEMRFASDGTLVGATWSGWGTATAVARGTAVVHVCTSSCGAGFNRRYPATVTLSGARSCGGRRFYVRARVSLATVAGSRPWGSFIKPPC